jgi:hypothetical protein
MAGLVPMKVFSVGNCESFEKPHKNQDFYLDIDRQLLANQIFDFLYL